MPDMKLSLPERALLLILMAENGELCNAEIRERYGPGLVLTGKHRQRLVDEELGHVEQLFQRIAAGRVGTTSEREECLDVLAALKLASLCGLGSGAADFAESVMRHYGKEFSSCFA